MLQFGLGLAIVIGALSGVASAQTAETAVAAGQSKPEKAHRSRGKNRPVITAQPLMVPPLPERKTAKASPIPPPPDTWSAAEIDAAKARCTAALKGLDADVTAEAPIKEGLCGTPAPVRLSRLGGVTFSPAALINCGMLVPLNTWISKELQPSAQRQLGAKITKIEVMSDYSCRTAFGRVGRKLSEHAYVDALDIRGFVTAKNEEVVVLTPGVPPTETSPPRLRPPRPRKSNSPPRRPKPPMPSATTCVTPSPAPAKRPRLPPPPRRSARRIGCRQGDAQPRHRQSDRHLVWQRQEASRRPPRRTDDGCSPRPTRGAKSRSPRVCRQPSAPTCWRPRRRDRAPASCAKPTRRPAASSARRSGPKPTRHTATTSMSTWPSGK